MINTVQNCELANLLVKHSSVDGALFFLTDIDGALVGQEVALMMFNL
jgi:hypothetical protein